MLNIGLTVDVLFEELEKVYPNSLPSPHDAYETIMYRAGQRSVVEWIKQRINLEEL
jgi:hypothetical protein